MLFKIEQKSDLQRIEYLFSNIRFFMGNSVLDGLMGEAYTDNINSPKFAILLVRTYCFMSGIIENDKLEELIDSKLKDRILIPSDKIKKQIENIYKQDAIKTERYSIKKNPKFDAVKLKEYSTNIPDNYIIKLIDRDMYLKIRNENYINTTDDYEKYGVGYCCLYNNEIVGVATSNIFYKDGIEVNIKVSENHRRKGIATALASNLILECIGQKRKISWDAANMNSVKLAKKLGFEYDSTYNVYKFEK